MKTQLEMFYDSHRYWNEADHAFFMAINDPTNPTTVGDLRKLIKH